MTGETACPTSLHCLILLRWGRRFRLPIGLRAYWPALQFITKLNASTLPIPVAKFQDAPVP